MFFGQVVDISWDKAVRNICIVSYDCEVSMLKISKEEITTLVEGTKKINSIHSVTKSKAKKASKASGASQELVQEVQAPKQKELPQPKPIEDKIQIFKSKYFPNCHFEVRNIDEVKITKFEGDKACWQSFFKTKIAQISESKEHLAAALESGHLNLFSHQTGNFVFQPILFSDQPFFIHIENDHLLAIDFSNFFSLW